MKVELLKSGQTFKNYKELCLELGMEIKKSTNSKNAQYKELARYCDYSKVGHQITINEVFSEQKPKIDNRKNNNSVYRGLVEFLVCDYLAQYEGNICPSRNELMLRIGMINVNYGFCSQNVAKLSAYFESTKKRTMDEKLIYDFYNKNNGNFKGIVESALDSLMDKRVIRYSKVRKVHLNNEYLNRVADPEEEYIIDDTEKEVLIELGYESMFLVRQSKDWLKFKTKVSNLLSERTHIKYYYNAYNIRVSDKYIEDERDKLLELLLDDSRREQLKSELNETIINRIIEKAQKRHEKEINGTWGTSKNKMSAMRRGENYVSDFELLSAELIQKDVACFRDSVEKVKLKGDLLEEFTDEELFQMFG
ncbi:hypothetical protein [Cytobacillus oceanisediminis]|uniref:hypothetical protein n=1 Tax=Cytobacillus oceanisediminis TaxID=665099 RepID=UPI001FB3989E|nr:hypothetical protein [Cytobacillus oceanisediminis]UOE57296.1 hypothetical protein IRB79_11355 [Cytobacillus oceanisediminis]